MVKPCEFNRASGGALTCSTPPTLVGNGMDHTRERYVQDLCIFETSKTLKERSWLLDHTLLPQSHTAVFLLNPPQFLQRLYQQYVRQQPSHNNDYELVPVYVSRSTQWAVPPSPQLASRLDW